MSRLTRAAVVCAVIVGLTLSSSLLFDSAALAQDTEQKLEGMHEQAMSDYDVLQMGAAKKKLENAIDIAEREGITGPVVAKLYVMLGIVVHAQTKDNARVEELFVQALKQDRSAKVNPSYKTPSLSDIMEKAREQVGPPPDDGTDGTDGTDEGKRIAGFEHEPAGSARATEGLTLEAFVPEDMPVYRMWAYYRQFGEDEYDKMEMTPTSNTRFAVEIPPEELRSSQIDYYIQAVNRGGDILAHAGSKEVPLNVTILGSGEVGQRDGDGGDGTDGDGKKDGGKKDDQPDKPSTPSDQKVYVHLGPGTGGGFVMPADGDGGPGAQVTGRPHKKVRPGMTPTLAHALLEAGYIIDQTHQIGIYFRWQFIPEQDFSRVPEAQKRASNFLTTRRPCFGTGLPGDCLLGVKYRNFFMTSDSFRLYGSGGLGIGRTRNWLRIEEPANNGSGECDDKDTFGSGDSEYCLIADTVRPGWFHFGGGLGITLPLSTNVGLFGDGYVYLLVPDTAIGFDVNAGLRMTF